MVELDCSRMFYKTLSVRFFVLAQLSPLTKHNRLVNSILERKTREVGHIQISEPDILQIIELTRRGFGTPMDAEDIRNHLLPVDLLYIAREGERIFGFASSEVKDGSSYFSGVVVDREYHKAGLASDFARVWTKDAFDLGCRSLWTRTQNPIVEHMMGRALDELKEGQTIGDWSVERTLMAGRYGRMLTDRIPLSRDVDLNRVYTELDYPRGDAYQLDFVLR